MISLKEAVAELRRDLADERAMQEWADTEKANSVQQECPDCGGSGTIEVPGSREWVAEAGQWFADGEQCGMCNGTGVL